MTWKTRILGKLFTPISNFGSPYLGNGLSYEAEILCAERYGIELFKTQPFEAGWFSTWKFDSSKTAGARAPEFYVELVLGEY